MLCVWLKFCIYPSFPYNCIYDNLKRNEQQCLGKFNFNNDELSISRHESFFLYWAYFKLY